VRLEDKWNGEHEDRVMRNGMGRVIAAGVLALVMSAGPGALAQDKDGVNVGGRSVFRYLASAESLEKLGAQQYSQLVQKANQQGALLPPNHPQSVRLRKIFEDLLPHSYKFNERAKDWKWEVNVLNARSINAFCMPGGKIAFFTGILEQLRLTDDEVAMVMGHEIAHALREHARERAGKQLATRAGAIIVGVLSGSQAIGEIANAGGGLLSLKFSRDDETESDLVGMELAARGGYDPRAGITLWEKMGGASRGAPPQWLSTHPSGPSRINTIKSHLKEVMPLYETARRKTG
jgi:Zn-dependent protease with chaperone function